MKNIHILPTDKPSRLYIDEGFLKFNSNYISENGYFINQNIYITSDEEIKDGDYYLYLKDNSVQQFIYKHHIKLLRLDIQKKIILTDNQDLIDDSVQAIDDEFLEWFVNNPSYEWVEVTEYLDGGFSYGYKIIIPKEEPKQERMYSEEEVLDLFVGILDANKCFVTFKDIKEWFEQNKNK